jgi:hypothetical protein
VAWPPERDWTPADLTGLAARGHRGIDVDAPVDLGTLSGAQSVRFLWLLREAANVGLRVRWRGCMGTVPVALVRHLSPPVDETTGKLAWHRPGPAALIVRQGPGFLVVEDVRSGRLARTVVDADDERHPLLRSPEPPWHGDPTDAHTRLLDDRLAVRLDGWVLALPLYLRRSRHGAG